MIDVTMGSNVSLYQQIYEQLKHKIISGELEEGTRLTSTRALAKNLCVARNTVESAYAQLCVEGYVSSKPGSGYYVMNMADDSLFIHLAPHLEKCSEKVGTVSQVDSTEYSHDFQFYNLEHASFPFALWRRLSAEALASFDARKICFYNDKQGELDLRTEITKYIRDSRGVRCTPDQVVLCCGTQHALDVICTLFHDGNRTVAVEIFGISVGPEGIDLDELDRTSTQLTYITPSHQFPTGVVMPIHKRVQLLQWATKRDGIIIEDDYDSELRYHTRPIPSLHSTDINGRVIYKGTFSKSLSPGLRMSYIILPKWLLPKYHTVFAGYNATISWFQQKIISLYMERGHWERHIRKVCLHNKKKHDILIKTIHEQMGDRVRIHGNNAGLHFLLEFVQGEKQEWLIEKAREHKVRVYPTRPYWHRKERCRENFILMGFSMLSEKEIVEGIALLKKAWFEQ
jgi:GntR family transcriptional regulator/MocR family aminotransferase